MSLRHCHVSVVLMLLSAATGARAQEGMPTPPEQLKKFAPMIGTWEGSGMVTHGPDGSVQEPWTSKSSAKWILGGFFVRDDMRIEMESMAQPLEMITIYGWDPAHERYISIGVSNLGEVGQQEVYWTPDGKMVTAEKKVMMGTPMIERWVSEFLGDGRVKFAGHQAQGDGPWFQHVDGEMRRTSDKASAVDVVDAAFVPEMVGLARKELAKLQPTLGEYRIKGWWMPEPGAAKMNFTGTESVRTIFGGTVIETLSKGDAEEGMPGYEGIWWLAWDAHDGCYVACYANSMGEIGSMQCELQGDKFIGTAVSRQQGKPCCMRGVTTLGPDGFVDHEGHMMLGATPPAKVFEATYERKK